MTLIKIIILIAISYCCCCCSLICCASGGEFEAEAGSSTEGNADSNSQRAELDKLGKLLFIGREEFNRERPRILETNEVGPLLIQFEYLQDRVIRGPPNPELQISQQTIQNQDDQAQNRWANPALGFLVGSLQQFISLAEEEDKEKILNNCQSLVTIKNVKGTSSLVTETFPSLSKFAVENYDRIIQKCVDLLKSRFEVFLSMLGGKVRDNTQEFGRIISSSMDKLRLFSPEIDEEMKRLAFTEATARFVERFGGEGTMICDAETDMASFRKHFTQQTRVILDPICEKIQHIPLNIVFDTVKVLIQIEPGKLKSVNGFDEYKHWVSVSAFCQIWQHTISAAKVYNAHLSFHMESRTLSNLKELNDALFSPSARRIGDAKEIESRLRNLRHDLATGVAIHNLMFKLNVNELNVLLDMKNRNSQTGNLAQQIEPFIRYYESIEAHNIVFYLNSLLNEQTGNSLAEIETILRAGNEDLANYPQINANLRELRRFLPGSNNIMPDDLTISDLLTGLTDYFLSNLRNFERMSEVKAYQSRKDLVTRWFNQFMVDNCQKYKNTFDKTLLAQNIFRSGKALSGLDDELKLVLCNVILCSNMDFSILNNIDALTRLIASRVDGGGPSDQLDEMTQIGL